MHHPTDCPDKRPPHKFNRRNALVTAGVAAVAALSLSLLRRQGPARAPVFLARNQRYDGPLAETIAAGLAAVGFDKDWVRGRKVLLEAEPCRAPSPRRRSARTRASCWPRPKSFAARAPRSAVGEGPGHVRDTEMALVESGMDEALHDEKLPFVDFNYASFARCPTPAGVAHCPALHVSRGRARRRLDRLDAEAQNAPLDGPDRRR